MMTSENIKEIILGHSRTVYGMMCFTNIDPIAEELAKYFEREAENDKTSDTP